MSKLSESVSEIMGALDRGETMRSIARRFGVSDTTIHTLVRKEKHRRKLTEVTARMDWRDVDVTQTPGLQVRTMNCLCNLYGRVPMRVIVEAFESGEIERLYKSGEIPNFGKRSYEDLSRWFADRGIAPFAAIDNRIAALRAEISRLEEEKARLCEQVERKSASAHPAGAN